jgi:hypothetical protein
MSDLTIKHRAAAVRNSWSFSERVERAVAAEQRTQRLFALLGIAPKRPKLAYARQAIRPCPRLTG